MTWSVHHVAGSLAGTQGAGQVVKRSVERKEPARETRRFRDEFDQFTEASEAEAVDAARSLKDNTQEEAHEDRQERGEQFPLPGAREERRGGVYARTGGDAADAGASDRPRG